MALTRATDKIIANADGNLNLSGIVTASSFSGPLVPSGDLNVGSNIKLGTASGIVTATGSGATKTVTVGAGVSTLAALSDTTIASSAAGQTLLYDASDSYDNKQIKVFESCMYGLLLV